MWEVNTLGWMSMKALSKQLIFLTYLFWGKAELIFQNARFNEHMRNLCVFRDRMYLCRLTENDLRITGIRGVFVILPVCLHI
jgi:hypothetical protein